ncbi:RNA-dependent RNA polymerase [Persimmon virus A]|uniref:Replicase n=2 Tax=Persimmon virus A TaxID=1211480 RepID=R4WAJ5_9RHAB|nr:RNA-dependent RNA polymerase [Persimmon virus A]BAM36035.2 RNA-dependent RNA polymerase [Persimmon virus A]
MDYMAFCTGGAGDGETDVKANDKFDNLPDYHLRNPLHPMKYLYTEANRSPIRIRKSLSSLRSHKKTLTEGSPEDLITSMGDLIPIANRSKLYTGLGDIIMRLTLDEEALPQLNGLHMEHLITEITPEMNLYLWDCMRFWGDVLLTMNAMSSRRPAPSCSVELQFGCRGIHMNDGVTCYITGSVIAMESADDSKGLICYDADWIRMASDVWTQRFLLNLSTLIGNKLNSVVYPKWALVKDLIEWGDTVLKICGNEGYKLIKNYEAICIGELLSRGDPDSIVDNFRFLNNTVSDLYLESHIFGSKAEELIQILRGHASPHHITQVYGLHRLWGHPIVDNRKGMEKVKIIGRKEVTRDINIGKIASRYFKINFCKEYRKKYRKYPNIQPSESNLGKLINSNDPGALSVSHVDEQEWDEINFGKTFVIPETFNLSMIVSDKAISLTRSELVKNVRSKKSVMNPEKRRGVLRWINDVTLNPKEFLQKVNDGQMEDDHKIIGLTPKERELNPTPRMFALMSHPLRIYVVVTEQMLSEHILPMFPQITMTDSLLDLTKKTYSIARRQSPTLKLPSKGKLWASRTVCMSLDFEKWNGHMRKESTEPIFTCLGDLFGMKELYNVTYDLFSESYLYLADGSYVPIVKNGELIEEGTLSFSGHKGGMEGLRQKGWTIFTVCCLDMICSKYNCTYKIMGMGDNQVLQITVFTYSVDGAGVATDKGKREMRGIIYTLFDDLVSTFGKLGLPLKPLETWMSEDLHLYGKYPVWRGVPLCMDLKKIMRMFAYSNDDIMTLENALGTIYGNAASATQGTCFCLLPYIVGIMMSSLCVMDFMDYHPFLGEGLNKHMASDMAWNLSGKDIKTSKIKIGEHGMNNSMIRLMIQIVPRTLGGYNSLNMYELMMRGFPDNLSRDLSYIYKILMGSPPGFENCLKNWLAPLYMPTKNYQLLIEDVSSVNVISPRTPLAGIKQTVEKFISDPKRIRNPEFRGLMSGKIRDQAQELAASLCEGDDLHIRLLHDIYEATIIGYIDSILSKVTKSSTIQRLAVSKSKFDSMSAVYKDEINCFRFFLWRCSVRSDEAISPCPTTHAKKMREKSWGKNLRGITTPFPMSYLARTECGENKLCNCEDGYISVHFPDKQINEYMWNTSIGRNPPYLGSMTKEKVITGLVGKAYSSEPLIRRPLRLMRVINWYVPPSSNTADVIRSTVRAVTDTDPDHHEGKVEGTAGAEVHRYRDTSLKHGALTSSNYLYPTRYHISTDHFTRYSKGGENYDVHFQACLCSIVEQTNIWISDQNRQCNPISKFQHYKQSCYECVNIVDETFIDIPDKRTSDLIPHRKENNYLYVKEDQMQDTLAYSPLISLKLTYLTNQMYQLMEASTKYRWLVETIADLVASDICSGNQNESFFSTGLTDVKSYERTMFLKINPKDLFFSVLNRLRTFARWKCASTKVSRMPTIKDIQRYLESYLVRVESDCMSGLSMFYGWEETYKKMNFHRAIILPNTVPASLFSSCESVRKTLIGMMVDEDAYMARENYYIPEDTKNNRFIIKLMISDYITTKTRCEPCILTVFNTESSTLLESLYSLVCSEGHMVFQEKMKIYQSHVTIERLRKDCASGMESKKTSFARTDLIPLPQNTVADLINFDRMRQRQINWGSALALSPPGSKVMSDGQSYTNQTSLRKIYSLPTSANYKYMELFSRYLPLIKGKNTFLVGDGLGSTSLLLSDMTGNNILVSTLLETDDAMPQSYPHLMQPIAVRESKTNVDRKTMINRVNDLSSESWAKDWKDAASNCEIVVSDIEILGKRNCFQRDNVLNKILTLKDWDFAIIKDYIFSIEELYDRLRYILSKVKGKMTLVSLGSKTPGVPEVWWVIRKTDHSRTVQLSYDPRSIKEEWNDAMYMLEDLDRDGVPKYIMDDMNERLFINNGLDTMHNIVRYWSTLPMVGNALPKKGNFTDLFYRLSSGKRPAIIHVERENKQLRMYVKDHYKIREVLFGMAVAMLANIKDREKILNESEQWILEWELGKESSDWYPYLYRSDDSLSSKINVNDYIPYLSCMMIRDRLSFGKFGKSIRFKNENMKKKDVFFPISATANLKVKPYKKNR